MPARTNEFPELFSLIKRALANPEDKVQVSVEIPGTGLDQPREIDILHTTTDGITIIRIAAEVKDESRPLDVKTIDEYHGKYTGEARVPVDKFMIVSRSGFTSGAREKAKRLGIPLLTLDEAKEFDWSKVGPEHTKIRELKSFHFEFPAPFDKFETTPPFPKQLASQIIQKGQIRGSRCAATCNHGTFLGFATWYLLKGNLPQIREGLQQMKELARKDPNGAYLEADWPLPNTLIVRYQGEDYPVRELHVKIHAVSFDTPVVCKSYEMKSSEGDPRLVHHLSMGAGRWKFGLVMPDGIKSKQIAVRMGDPKPKKTERPNARERAKARKKERRAQKDTTEKKREGG